MANFSHQQMFATVPQIDTPRSTVDLSHTHTTTFNPDYLIPFYLDEVLPGDTFDVKHTIFARTLTMRRPIMDNLWLETGYFYVPDRLLWENFKRFMGEKPNPDSSIDFLHPILSFTSETVTYNHTHSLYDYMGVPVGTYVDPVGGTRYYPKTVRAAWCRAYYAIWNDWFRNQNVQPSLTVPISNGPDNADYYELQKVNKIADYFTRMLPEPQEGDGVLLPLGSTAPVVGDGYALAISNGTSSYGLTNSVVSPGVNAFQATGNNFNTPAGSSIVGVQMTTNVALGLPTAFAAGEHSGLVCRLSDATAASINDIREAFAMQRVLERLARGGHRYIEIVMSLFNVVCPDFRAQRPEYLGGSKNLMNINTIVASTAMSAEDQQLGDMGSTGTLAANGNGFRKSFVEHGVIIGLMWVRGENRYDRGVHRMFTRRSRWDHYMPPMAHLGEQPVYRRELYARGTDDDDLPIGYNPAWLEYQYKPNRLSGLMRNNCFDSANGVLPSLNSWHVAQDLEYEDADLTSDFIESNTPWNRVAALEDEPFLKADILLSITANRPIPVRCVPGMVDHF